MYVKKFAPHSDASAPARTLHPSYLGAQPSGWVITGEVQQDYYEWVNYFEARHPTFGWIKGDFEDEVKAKSKKALEHFMEHHPPEEWDYWDI